MPDREYAHTTPFLLRFSHSMMPSTSGEVRRYDETRGVSQVRRNGLWVDRLDVLEEEPLTTFETRVKQKTTELTVVQLAAHGITAQIRSDSAGGMRPREDPSWNSASTLMPIGNCLIAT